MAFPSSAPPEEATPDKTLTTRTGTTRQRPRTARRLASTASYAPSHIPTLGTFS